MSRKILIAIILCIVMIIPLTVIFVNGGKKKSEKSYSTPTQVSVFIPEENSILLVSFDEFLTGCVRGLLPKDEKCNEDALNAVTAAMKTRILYHLQNRISFNTGEYSGADFLADENFPYTRDNGNSALNERLRYAAEITQPITIDGKLFDAEVCRISSGRTDNAPFCPSVSLLCDMDAEYYTSRFAFTHEEVWQIMKAVRAPADREKWFQNAVYEETDTLRSIEFCSTEISGTELRRKFGLPSKAIFIEYENDNFYFVCKGCGDNQGLSVNAAVFLSKSGYSAKDIIAVFYPEATYSEKII